ncbi:MAG: hypothetical protein KDE04_18260, partial [Anaerolineales bacterium]|nr:hypothetical protein [Anaerolineales bacterium]
DGEIRHFLADRPVPVYNRPDWLPADAEGDAVAGTIIQAGHSVATLPHPTLDGGDALPPSESVAPPGTGSEAEIAALLQAGHSQNEVQRRLFGYTGGAAYAAVRQVAARLAEE